MSFNIADLSNTSIIRTETGNTLMIITIVCQMEMTKI